MSLLGTIQNGMVDLVNSYAGTNFLHWEESNVLGLINNVGLKELYDNAPADVQMDMVNGSRFQVISELAEKGMLKVVDSAFFKELTTPQKMPDLLPVKPNALLEGVCSISNTTFNAVTSAAPKLAMKTLVAGAKSAGLVIGGMATAYKALKFVKDEMHDHEVKFKTKSKAAAAKKKANIQGAKK